MSAASAPPSRFLCASPDAARHDWLQRTLAGAGAVEAAPCDAAGLVARIGESAPAIVFVDFSAAANASTLAHAARDAFPDVPIVALGTLATPAPALAALRAGVRDFADIDGPSGDVRAIAQRLIDERPRSCGEPRSRDGKLTVLLGARIGVGVSTLAANLAVSLQRRGLHAGRATALLDLGLPAADSALLLDMRCELHFVDAVRNLRRFDDTFVNTAFARHASGLALTTLPADLAEMRAISFASAVSLLNRLRAYFDHQIVDLGGFSNAEFVTQTLQAADEAWLVCDANVASAVSAMSLLDALRPADEDTPLAKIGLVVNKFDAALNFGADQLAQRLNLPLVGVLPERAQALGRAVNQGRLLADCAGRDPYVRALAPLVARLDGELPEEAAHAPAVRAGRRTARKALDAAHLLPHFLRRS
ncbi:response regulator receiver protein [Caballeronia novacaledonica]|uniref:Response regulator receiver protein n=1 Tax=Caballeronia novacaledonica TaxID=1544861 RepID=A0A2U3I5S5_9BURK|nr:fimbrial protein [Caballeronia novacaledonica]SPB15465.1 response regulator receiver protein [Caballeronia novacaledonica]